MKKILAGLFVAVAMAFATPASAADVHVEGGVKIRGGDKHKHDRHDRHDHGRRHRHHHHGHPSFSFGFGWCTDRVIVVEPRRVWVSGYYETRYETVLVEPERTEKVWDGKCWVEKYTPPRYETREFRVYVPGYWAHR